ncbi:hypothetical protein [Mesoplasma seiffertii]|uniref:hypothetical protein n=1 Tax=Mesoplasma seiffertii TaxID=28224 RepID=UPI00047C4127|nr:hypothetical protein [Mesoplasma seiffertii]
MKKTKDSIKNYRHSQKQVHQEEVNKIVQDTYNSRDQNAKLFYYRNKKKLHVIGWLLPIIFSTIATGLSFLIGWALYWNFNLNGSSGGWAGVGWVSFAFLILFILSYMILSWVRNKKAAEFFNHKGRRYQLMLTDWEATVIKWKRILMLTILLMIVVTSLTISLL